MLQYFAVCCSGCSTLQCVFRVCLACVIECNAYCIVLLCDTECCSVLRRVPHSQQRQAAHVAVCCSVLQCVAVCCSMLQYIAMCVQGVSYMCD